MHVEQILNILDNHAELNDYHNFRTRESGGTKFVEAHLVFNEKRDNWIGQFIELREAYGKLKGH